MATPTVNLVASSSLTPASSKIATLALADPILPMWKTRITLVSQSLTKFDMTSMFYRGPLNPVAAKHAIARGLSGKLSIAAVLGPSARKRPRKGQLWPRTR